MRTITPTRISFRASTRSWPRAATICSTWATTADGTIPPEAARILRNIGEWYRAVKESFHLAELAFSITDNRDVLLTRKGNTLYVHLFKDPPQSSVMLNPLDTLPRNAIVLNTGAEVEARVDLTPRFHMDSHGRVAQDRRETLRIRNLLVNELANTVMVLKLEFDRPPPW